MPEIIKASGGSAKPVLIQFISDLTKLKIGYYNILDHIMVLLFFSRGQALGKREAFPTYV